VLLEIALPQLAERSGAAMRSLLCLRIDLVHDQRGEARHLLASVLDADLARVADGVPARPTVEAVDKLPRDVPLGLNLKREGRRPSVPDQVGPVAGRRLARPSVGELAALGGRDGGAIFAGSRHCRAYLLKVKLPANALLTQGDGGG
jgi:hypothetical protein